ncbi:MAG: hypothetical protein NTV63_03885 [Candidatus Woesearchaeota archaeon]|nr:hypothetical protein [Candidatus Woesearchaeota archaeon]
MQSKKIILFMLFLLLALPIAVPANYYADVEISIDSSGRALVSGTTNHPILSVSESNSFTSKNGAYWLFNMSFPENFSDYIYSVILPAGASINYIKAENPVRIENSGGRISVIGIGHLQKFSIAIQYRISEKKDFRYTSFIIFSSLIAAGLILYLISRRLEKKSKSPENENKN